MAFLPVSVARRPLMAAAFTVALAALTAAAPASAQDYPTRPIRIVVPFAAGGGVDILTRTLAQHLGERLASRCWSTTGPAPAATSASTRSPSRRPTATRW